MSFNEVLDADRSEYITEDWYTICLPLHAMSKYSGFYSKRGIIISAIM